VERNRKAGRNPPTVAAPVEEEEDYYLEQNEAHPSPSLVIKTFSTKEITSRIKSLK
jgi:hypothetical protein